LLKSLKNIQRKVFVEERGWGGGIFRSSEKVEENINEKEYGPLV
jgi:hypothetical protein